ncbi:MAG: hypothetical protein GFH27_549285n96 [Chloroflexi bacterium AL-W]|nr:hypothetical protein [Chloroflexi bacterium AL-N1]NOK65608.1 hypothetical protein [Chloroflexi bacterium AL-N10]NOK74451.1 hypothetical protein [Chloroflexi bacterium AL-N5]NOK80641.1 hypothetical protein [Chloroflexi bacterium AL-W]NOK88709.1 hypothetical protein [Chloroflexi bacterium AL-N15]
MTTVSIIFHSGFGHTAKVAEHVATGARAVEGVNVNLLSITGEQIVDGRWQNDAVMTQLSVQMQLSLAHQPTWAWSLVPSNALPMQQHHSGLTSRGRINWQVVLPVQVIPPAIKSAHFSIW